MSNVRISPHYAVPEVLMQYAQMSGATNILATSDPQVRLSNGDLFVYMKKLAISSNAAVGQNPHNNLPMCSVVSSEISVPTYRVANRAEYDHHEINAASREGYSLPMAQQLACRQGIMQSLRNMALYGKNPASGEGLLNTQGATLVSLVADQFGNTTVSTYDAGHMATMLLRAIKNMLSATYSTGEPVRIEILGPQRVLSEWNLASIIQTTNFQRIGAGSATVGEAVQIIAEQQGYSVGYSYDDTLIGKGAGGTDAIIITIPELKRLSVAPMLDTNAFASLTPGNLDCNVMFTDVAAPTEIMTPIAGGGTDVLFEMRATPGWGVRPEATTIYSMPY